MKTLKDLHFNKPVLQEFIELYQATSDETALRGLRNGEDMSWVPHCEDVLNKTLDEMAEMFDEKVEKQEVPRNI